MYYGAYRPGEDFRRARATGQVLLFLQRTLAATRFRKPHRWPASLKRHSGIPPDAIIDLQSMCCTTITIFTFSSSCDSAAMKRAGEWIRGGQAWATRLMRNADGNLRYLSIFRTQETSGSSIGH